MERQNGTMRHFIGHMRRLVLAFSKSPEHLAAAVALRYVHYNLCHVVRTLRVTPAMAAGITDHVWEIRELCEAPLSAVPCSTPDRKPITIPAPNGTARELPNGRGFLRVVAAGGPVAPSPAPAPVTPPPVATGTPVPAQVDPSGQLEHLAARPALGTLDWSRANTGVWEGRALHGGRLSKNTSSVVLTANAIKLHLGLELGPEELRLEQHCAPNATLS